MKKLLSIFSFEGFILDYPIPREEISDWLKNPKCLSYPLIPDIPGPTYWDQFAISIIKECQKDPNHEICIFSEIEVLPRETKKRIKFLFKSVGIKSDIIFLNDRSERLDLFYKKNINIFLTKALATNDRYEEVNIYLNDFESTSLLADHIRINFSLKTLLHDI